MMISTSRSGLSRWCLLACLGLPLVCEPEAHARSRREHYFSIDLATGRVRSQERPTSAPAAPPEVVASGASYSQDGSVRLLERGPDGRPRVDLRLAIGDIETEWMPWSVVLDDWLVFAWYDIGTPAAHLPEPQHVWHGVDLKTSEVRWRRTMPVHMPPGAWRLGDHLVIIDTAAAVEIVDGRTGTTVRRLAKDGESFSVRAVSGGRALVEAGAHLHLLNAAGATEWQVTKAGDLRHVLLVKAARATVLDVTRPWLLKTTSHTYRLDPGTGTIAWAAESPSDGQPKILSGRMYEAWRVTAPDDKLEVSLVERNVQNGKVLRRWPVQQWTAFTDQARADVVAASAGRVQVRTEFIVLD